MLGKARQAGYAANWHGSIFPEINRKAGIARLGRSPMPTPNDKREARLAARRHKRAENRERLKALNADLNKIEAEAIAYADSLWVRLLEANDIDRAAALAIRTGEELITLGQRTERARDPGRP